MESERPLSVHDSLLTGYEVDGLTRTIVLHTQPHDGGGEAFIDVRFDGVAAYHFQGDALQNIVFDVTPATSNEFAEIAKELTDESARSGAAPGWNPRVESVEQFIARSKLTVFVLSSSYGMAGWVAAQSSTRILRSAPTLREDRVREIEAAIRTVLMNDWDPIGVRDVPEAQNEYDRYVGAVYRLIASRAEPEQIAAHLAHIQTTTMGLEATPHQCLAVAERLRRIDVALYGSRQ